MTTALSLIIALLSMYPHMRSRREIESNASAIATMASDAADLHAVPVSIVIAVGFYESRLGMDPHSGGSVGAPHDRRHRHVAGGWTQQASSLALGFRRCGAWLPALRHFRCGTCFCRPRVGYSPEAAMALSNRMTSEAR